MDFQQEKYDVHTNSLSSTVLAGAVAAALASMASMALAAR